MQKDINSYKNIFKAISLFGGLKIFQIIIGIIKNKFIAVLLGPTGMGIAGMITSTTSLVASLTGFGLETSAVRDVSQAHSSHNEDEINKVITVLRKLILLTGILGMVLTFLFSSYLSIWAFGNNDYSFSFKLVSIILLLNQLSIGQTVLLQGTFNYKLMAKASFYGSIAGMVITVPLYYIYGFNAIVPSIIIASLLNLLLTWFYSLQIKFKPEKINLKQTLIGGKTMIVLGIVIALTGIINTSQVYILRLVISKYGNLNEVGLYTAGMTIATSYIGIVLSAMSSDYSPRLASVAYDNHLMTKTINKQAILLTTIIAPLIIIFIVFIKQVTILLYSEKFIAISGMIEWVMFGMFFRTISWSISFSFIANNNSNIFLINEIISSCYSLILSITGYMLLGFTGLGIAFCLSYIIYTFHMYVLARNIFGFYFTKNFFQIALPQILFSSIIFIVIKLIFSSQIHYIFGSISIAFILCLSYYHLNQLIEIRNFINSFLKRKIKN